MTFIDPDDPIWPCPDWIRRRDEQRERAKGTGTIGGGPGAAEAVANAALERFRESGDEGDLRRGFDALRKAGR